jgi:integrase/recombinase XerC
VFVADLATARDRAVALLMLLGALRAMEVRGLWRVALVGKGVKERTLRCERPPGCATRERLAVQRGSHVGGTVLDAIGVESSEV